MQFLEQFFGNLGVHCSRAVAPECRHWGIQHLRAVAPRCIPAVLLVFLALVGVMPAAAQQYEYERPVSAAPTPEDIGEGYAIPQVQFHPPRAQWREALDVGVLLVGLGLTALVVLKWRSRWALVLIVIGSLVYFGFYRQGCICSIGAIQNVVATLADPQAVLSWYVIAFFFLPLIAALFFGRVFCGGVCPLGAAQELILVRPMIVPRLLDQVLSWGKWVYLGLAIYFAARPAAERDFIICRFDPFVGFFRLSGPLDIMLLGAGLLLLGMFIGRPYCRWLCPYGALLSLCSRLSWRNVTITPDKELDCGLCAEACPYGAIRDLRADLATCVACARCYDKCPRHRVQRTGGQAPAGDAP